jgi:hypothetical protein
MVKRLKVSMFAAALAAIGLLTTGCGFLGGGSPFWNTDVSSWTRIFWAILREDLFS